VTPPFPQVDRNRLISKASKQMFGQQAPASWQEVEIGGDADFGFDMLVQLAVGEGIQHVFMVQLKGTESPTFIADGSTLSFTLKNRTLNLYANVAPEVMLVVAVVELDAKGKLDASRSNIYWQWMSTELKVKRGSSFELDEADGTTKVHIPCTQVLHPELDVLAHLEAKRALIQAGVTLEDLLQRAQSLSQTGRPSYISQLADFATHKPAELTAFLQAGGQALSADLPAEAHAIRALIRAGQTALAESALARLGPTGFGTTPTLEAALLSLRAKVLMQRGRRSEAAALFERAHALDDAEGHLLALAETRLLAAIDDDGGLQQVAAVRELLSGANSDDGLALRVRVHAYLKEFAQAQACLDQIPPAQQLMPKLVLLTTQCRWQEAIDLAHSAEDRHDIPTADLTSAQLVAARAAWCGATEHVAPLQVPDELPLAGAVGTRLDLAQQAWGFCLKCLNGLRQLGWSSNTEILAPIVAGVAPLLGHQAEALALLSEAAAHRPEYADLQLNTELLAITADQPEAALAANLRQTGTLDVLTRRASLLFDLRRFSECEATALAVTRSQEAKSDKTPMALAMGYASAHRLGHLVEAAELKAAIDFHSGWEEYTYFAEFVRQGVLETPRALACSTLRDGLVAHPHSWMLAANLYANLEVSDKSAAGEVVQLARILRHKALLKADEAAHLVAAYITLENWHEAATEASDALLRFDSDDRLLGMAAIAQEMLGHTGAAVELLERALAVGTKRISAVHNYMGLSLRLGRVNAVRTAIDRLQGLVTDPQERIELMRLSALIYLRQECMNEALAAAEALGQLVDQEREEQEGIFLNVFLAVTTGGARASEALQQQMGQRIDAFCTKWPDSNMFRRCSLPEVNEGQFDVHGLMDQLLGTDSREQMRMFQQRERLASRGEFPVPFTLRPGLVLHYVGNPFQLWEIAMRSHADEQQFHLNMVIDGDEPKSPNAARDIPLLDLSALLVLDALGLLDDLFTVFTRVAVSGATVAYLSQHANGVFAGREAARAESILAWVNRWVQRIDQPITGKVAGPISIGIAHERLARRPTWRRVREGRRLQGARDVLDPGQSDLASEQARRAFGCAHGPSAAVHALRSDQQRR
jgi:tetratricopeptide (TPR) repeat protein